jgi:hypothetical protein
MTRSRVASKTRPLSRQPFRSLIRRGMAGDVRGGDLRSGSTICLCRREEQARGGAGLWAEPGHDCQNVPLFGAARLCAVQGSGTAEARTAPSGDRCDRIARARSREVFVPLAHPPGHAQVDFGECIGVIGGVRMKLHVFCFDLPQSDTCFIKAYPAETTEAFLDGHVSAALRP